MKGNLYTLVYAGILGSVCALLLTAAATFTKPYKEANAEAERKRNVLNVLQVPYDQAVSAQELLKVFESNVTPQKLGELEIFRYVPPKDSDAATTVAVAFEGPGLWGPIKGFLALESDMRTIRVGTFYEQEETPGLGGEIVATWFREQFEGKSIIDDKGNAGIIISSGGEEASNRVNAITGATMTCDKVQAMLNEAIKTIVQEK